jgi:hypothetical protein
MNNKDNALEILDSKSNIDYNTPVLFDRKIKNNIINYLTYIKNDSGRIKHFTPAAQEWFNSLYSYNINYPKSLPVADTTLMKLLKSYFNLQLNHKILKIKRVPNRLKRIGTKRIFVGKGDIKHTNDKIIITFYVHNTENKFLSRALFKMENALYQPKKRLSWFVSFDRNQKRIITYNRPFSLREYKYSISHINKEYTNYIIRSRIIDINNLYLSNLNTQYRILSKLEIMKIISQEDKIKIFLSLCENIDQYKHPDHNKYKEKALFFYLKKYKMLKKLYMINRLKFNKPFMSKLTRLVEGLYNKKVIFNIVNLKKMHFNSDIFTQVVSLKLRNRDNRLYRVLKSSLRKVKIRTVNKLKYKGLIVNKDDFFNNKIRNSYINSMFTNIDNSDPLNNLLVNFFPSAYTLKYTKNKKVYNTEDKAPLEMYVLTNLKQNNMAGIRVEAKGRLTRRFTASRSQFKMKWKGGLKNVDSSFKGWSALILRGHAKSNVQYSFIKSKTRNGAFGVKGWVSTR